jgi:uncharacterized membrane protein
MNRPVVRFGLETVFLVGVALAVAVANASVPVTVAALAAAWLVVFAVERRVRRRGR